MKWQTDGEVAKTSLTFVSVVFCVYLSKEDVCMCTKYIICYCLFLTGVKAHLPLRIDSVTGKNLLNVVCKQ